jgi:hypothetical protein
MGKDLYKHCILSILFVYYLNNKMCNILLNQSFKSKTLSCF